MFVYAKYDFMCVYVICMNYIRIYVYVCVCVCVYVCVCFSDVCVDLFLASRRVVFRRLNSPELHLNIQSVQRSKHTPSQL